MPIENLTADEKARIKNLIKEGVNTLQEIKDLREGLNELVNAVSKELELPKKELGTALKIAFKSQDRSSALEEEKEALTNVEVILEIANK